MRFDWNGWFIGGVVLPAACSLAACGGSDDGADLREETPPDPVCDVTAPTECPAPAPVYADVQPIFQGKCVSCHFSASEGPWPLNSYRHVADWWDVIRDDLLACSMPPRDSNVTLSDEERQLILTWIRCGYPE